MILRPWTNPFFVSTTSVLKLNYIQFNFWRRNLTTRHINLSAGEINWISNWFPLLIHWNFNSISNGLQLVFQWYFYWIRTGFPIDVHCFFTEFSTGFPMDFHWHFIEISIQFQLYFKWISISILTTLKQLRPSLNSLITLLKRAPDEVTMPCHESLCKIYVKNQE